MQWLIQIAISLIATKREVSRTQVALAWVLNKLPITVPIVGATRIHHLEDAVAALSVKLDDNELASLEEPYLAHPVYGIKRISERTRESSPFFYIYERHFFT